MQSHFNGLITYWTCGVCVYSRPIYCNTLTHPIEELAQLRVENLAEQ